MVLRITYAGVNTFPKRPEVKHRNKNNIYFMWPWESSRHPPPQKKFLALQIARAQYSWVLKRPQESCIVSFSACEHSPNDWPGIPVCSCTAAWLYCIICNGWSDFLSNPVSAVCLLLVKILNITFSKYDDISCLIIDLTISGFPNGGMPLCFLIKKRLQR